MYRNKVIHLALISIVLFAFSACSQFMNTAMDAVGKQMGKKVGTAIGDKAGVAAAGQVSHSMHSLTPAFMQMYAAGMFSLVYHQGGYFFDVNQYKPGEWTKWKSKGTEQGSMFEKALIKELADGSQWWRVEASGEKNNKNETVILEALFSPADASGYKQLLRMRGKFPGDKEGGEIPVTENSHGWYSKPVKITEQSLKGATKGVETITVPSGTYKAKHIVYKDMQGAIEWWLSKKVPGGVVKYGSKRENSNSDKSNEYWVELESFGKGAVSKLGIE